MVSGYMLVYVCGPVIAFDMLKLQAILRRARCRCGFFRAGMPEMLPMVNGLWLR